MRRSGATGLAGLLVALVLALPAQAGRTVTTAQLALMPLPKQLLGAGTLQLPLDRDSGVVTNAQAAHDYNGNVTAQQLQRLGRVTGYQLDYNDPGGNALSAHHGLVEVRTGVDLHRDASSAAKGFRFDLHDETDVKNLRAMGLKISISKLPAVHVGDESYAFSGAVKLSGKPTFYGVDVAFRSGELVAFTSVTGAAPAGLPARAKTLAVALAKRIAAVRLGKVSGPPVPLPGKLKAGPPPHGPDLAAMVMTPADLGGGTVASQRYKLDPDLSPVSEYVRELRSAGVFVSLTETSALFQSRLEASYTIDTLRRALGSASFLAAMGGADFKANVKSYKPTPVAIHVGDEAYGVLAAVELKTGQTVYECSVLFRIGSTTEWAFGVAPAGARVLPSAVVDLARIAAARARAGLQKKPAGTKPTA